MRYLACAGSQASDSLLGFDVQPFARIPFGMCEQRLCTTCGLQTRGESGTNRIPLVEHFARIAFGSLVKHFARIAFGCLCCVCVVGEMYIKTCVVFVFLLKFTNTHVLYDCFANWVNCI
jgi:hypothetical protein